ncbi:MAG: sigma-54-dependent Fis family transcriptional regulator [Lentihominibacter sp.]|jgi:PAS domain S-box-containing protein
MFIYSDQYGAEVKKKWQRFIDGGEPQPAEDTVVRPEIWDSWRRSKALNISHTEVKDFILSRDELSSIRRSNELLMDVSHSYIQNIYSFVRGTNFVLALTDAQGYVLDLVGDDVNIQQRTKKSGLRVGSNRHESYAGTNGIGLCLELARPIQVWGCEHYILPHHDYVCSAAPIKDSEGKIIGVLDVVGPFGIPHSHTLAMVSASADGIEKEIKMREAYNRVSLANNQLSATVQSISSGIIMFDNMGTITQFNDRACDILKLSSRYIMNTNIVNIFSRNYSLDWTSFHEDIQNMEVSLATIDGYRIPVSLSVSIIKNAEGNKTGTVIVMDELKKLHMLVNKISGFKATYTFQSILGVSPAMESAKKIAELAAQSTSNVLILGESGTGKELFAQSIHNASDRCNGPFIAINCGSIPNSLIESELFGYEPGAFTGANTKGNPGKFELANGGTLFLDEIGDMPLSLQATLLRVLQTREIVRIGGKNSKSIDVRIIAATNVDLMESVAKKEFREDLYYRLHVLPIEIPPLRDRMEDLESMIDFFLSSQNKNLNKNVKGISPEALQILREYHWPGNVRELENAIERAINLCNTDILQPDDFSSIIVSDNSHSAIRQPAEVPPPYHTNQRTRDTGRAMPAYNEGVSFLDQLTAALLAERGNVTKVSKVLDIPKRTLYRKINKYDIDLEKYR